MLKQSGKSCSCANCWAAAFRNELASNQPRNLDLDVAVVVAFGEDHDSNRVVAVVVDVIVERSNVDLYDDCDDGDFVVDVDVSAVVVVVVVVVDVVEMRMRMKKMTMRMMCLVANETSLSLAPLLIWIMLTKMARVAEFPII